MTDDGKLTVVERGERGGLPNPDESSEMILSCYGSDCDDETQI